MYECKKHPLKENKLKQCLKYYAESFQFEQKQMTFHEIK